MTTPYTILFAADFSENSVEAFRLACAAAAWREARLIVLHAIDPDSDEAGATPGGEALRESLARRLLEVYIPDRPLEVDYRLAVGEPPLVILHAAAQAGVDLIAMGTHGRTGLRRLLAGSVALDVLHEARCSVLALSSRRGVHKAGDIRVILVPTDFSEAAEAALGPARSLARDLGARLVIMHVIAIEPYLDGTMAGEIDHSADRHTLDAMRDRLDGPDLKYPVETWLRRGRAGEEILRVAAELECDLIVMGTHGRSGVGRLLLGNVAEFVMPRADCAVLVAKQPLHEPVPAEGGIPIGAEAAG